MNPFFPMYFIMMDIKATFGIRLSVIYYGSDISAYNIFKIKEISSNIM